MAKHWIAGALKHPGAEGRAAKRAGVSTHALEERDKGKGGKGGARARLGLKLASFRKK